MDALTFQAEVRRIEKLMYRVSMSYLNNQEDAADAVQDTLARAWEKRHFLARQEHFKPWVMRILTNRWDVGSVNLYAQKSKQAAKEKSRYAMEESPRATSRCFMFMYFLLPH